MNSAFMKQVIEWPIPHTGLVVPNCLSRLYCAYGNNTLRYVSWKDYKRVYCSAMQEGALLELYRLDDTYVTNGRLHSI